MFQLLQSIFHTICYLNDINGTNDVIPSEPVPSIRKTKDLVFAALAFPVSMFVSTTFWSLMLIDRELVCPKALDPYFPSWLNHIMHTNVFLFALVEMYISYRKYPDRNYGMRIVATFMLTYLVWMHIFHAYTGMYVYPVIDKFDTPTRWMYFASNLATISVMYLIGEKLNAYIWDETIEKLAERSPRNRRCGGRRCVECKIE